MRSRVIISAYHHAPQPSATPTSGERIRTASRLRVCDRMVRDTQSNAQHVVHGLYNRDLARKNARSSAIVQVKGIDLLTLSWSNQRVPIRARRHVGGGEQNWRKT